MSIFDRVQHTRPIRFLGPSVRWHPFCGRSWIGWMAAVIDRKEPHPAFAPAPGRVGVEDPSKIPRIGGRTITPRTPLFVVCRRLVVSQRINPTLQAYIHNVLGSRKLASRLLTAAVRLSWGKSSALVQCRCRRHGRGPHSLVHAAQ